MKENITWTDRKTELEWQMNESRKRMTWDEAFAYAKRLGVNGHKDWRVPTDKELESLIDREKVDPALREEVPFRDSSGYWSSTTYDGYKGNAWYADFYGGYLLNDYKTGSCYVRCVRGEMR